MAATVGNQTKGVSLMKRALAVLFTVALLGVSVFATTAVASPAPVGGGNGVCNNNPGGLGNNGEHAGIAQHCVAI
jgi:hypothetical protein